MTKPRAVVPCANCGLHRDTWFRAVAAIRSPCLYNLPTTAPCCRVGGLGDEWHALFRTSWCSWPKPGGGVR